MSTCVGFQTQIASIMEVLTKAAVAEICRLVDDGYALLQLEISRSRQENEILRQKLSIQETGTARERAADEPTMSSSTGVFENRLAPPWRDDAVPAVVEPTDPEEERPKLLLVKEEDLSTGEPVRELNVIDERFVELEASEKPNRTDAATSPAEEAKGLSAWDDAGLDAVLKAEAEAELDEYRFQHSAFSSERRTCLEAELTTFEKPALEMCHVENAATEHEDLPDLSDSEGNFEIFPVTPLVQSSTKLAHIRPFKKPAWFLTQTADSQEKRFDCDYCRKSFSSSQNLEVHVRVHTGEKPFKCTHCGKSFAQLSNLITHRRIHTGEKPFHCAECGKRFADPGYLKRHQSVHTGEKPFSCLECGRSFSFSSNLARHRSIHARKDPSSCKRNKKAFIS